MQENQTIAKSKKRTPYLFYSFMGVVLLALSGIIVVGLSVYLLYALLEIIIEIVSPLGYVKQSYSYKKYRYLHRTSHNDADSNSVFR